MFYFIIHTCINVFKYNLFQNLTDFWDLREQLKEMIEKLNDDISEESLNRIKDLQTDQPSGSTLNDQITMVIISFIEYCSVPG